MHVSTAGIHVRARQRWLRNGVELISSMRFAISLLTVIAIASVIGTVLKQNEPFANYINQFGPFWFELFRVLGLYSVYNTPWFLLILGFLVMSTTLCIVRNAPKMIRDMRAWRDHVREESLRNFGHRQEFASAAARPDLAARMHALLARRGFKVKRVEHPETKATLLAAKAGTLNRLGYIFAHSAIVMICIGGLLDSELPIKAQVLFGGKSPVQGNMLIKDVPPGGRLSTSNPTFRANVLIPEGASARHAIVSYRDAALVQELPFTIDLKKFIVDYYSTGMPKLFASEVEVTDHDSGKKFTTTIKVNHPLIHKGIAVYQSSFEDGGSKLQLKAWPMQGAVNYTFPVQGEVGGNTPLTKVASAGAAPAAPAAPPVPSATSDLSGPTPPVASTGPASPTPVQTIEFTGFRAINVENIVEAQTGGAETARQAAGQAASVEGKFRANVAAVLSSGSSATRGARSKDLRNIGPSVQYKLRDATGQAREFSNYMLPVALEGHRIFLAGVRENPNENFRFLRIPADAEGGLTEFMRLRAALADPALRSEAARRFAANALPASALANPALREQLAASAQRGLETFAGAQVQDGLGGYTAVAAWLEKSVAKAEQENAVGVVMKILGGSIWELWQLARERDGLKPAEAGDANAQFTQLAMNALSDSFHYGAPVLLQLETFTQVQASVFQLTRSPGKNVVYLGCLFLVLGIFAMFYIRERRVWIWLKDDNQAANPGGAASRMVLAMSATRQTLDLENEFAALERECAAVAASPAEGPASASPSAAPPTPGSPSEAPHQPPPEPPHQPLHEPQNEQQRERPTGQKAPPGSN